MKKILIVPILGVFSLSGSMSCLFKDAGKSMYSEVEDLSNKSSFSLFEVLDL